MGLVLLPSLSFSNCLNYTNYYFVENFIIFIGKWINSKELRGLNPTPCPNHTMCNKIYLQYNTRFRACAKAKCWSDWGCVQFDQNWCSAFYAIVQSVSWLVGIPNDGTASHCLYCFNRLFLLFHFLLSRDTYEFIRIG